MRMPKGFPPLTPRFQFPHALIRNPFGHAPRASRRTLGVAAAGAAALASVGVGLSAATAPANAAVSTPVVLSQPAGPPMIVVPAGPAPSLQLPAQANPAFHPSRPAAHVRLTSTERPRGHGATRQAPAAHSPTAHSASGHGATQQARAAHRAPAARTATRHAWTVHPAQLRPYLIYDSVTPSAIPAHHEIATYATGGYAVAPSQVAGRKVLWIDTNGSDPGAAALDVEPGDATPSMAATWAWHKLHADPHGLAIIYTMQSEWPAAQAAVGSLPANMRSHVRWWIADPTGYPHIVPGSNATQWYWGTNYDITTAKPNF